MEGTRKIAALCCCGVENELSVLIEYDKEYRGYFTEHEDYSVKCSNCGRVLTVTAEHDEEEEYFPVRTTGFGLGGGYLETAPLAYGNLTVAFGDVRVYGLTHKPENNYIELLAIMRSLAAGADGLVDEITLNRDKVQRLVEGK